MTAIKNIIIGIILSSTLLLTTFQLIAFNPTWYQKEFSKLKITADSHQVANVLGYLAAAEDLEKNFYTEREILHLQDIKKMVARVEIVNYGILVFVSLVLLIVVMIEKLQGFFKTLLLANISALATWLIALPILQWKFDFLFIAFHQLSFSNDYWMLDPRVDSLINIFPPALFADLIKQTIALGLLCHLAGILLFGLVLILLESKDQNKT